MPATIVKPAAPMTLELVDVRLRNCALAMRHYAKMGEREERERVALDADRLLDVRLAIVKAAM